MTSDPCDTCHDEVCRGCISINEVDLSDLEENGFAEMTDEDIRDTCYLCLHDGTEFCDTCSLNNGQRAMNQEQSTEGGVNMHVMLIAIAADQPDCDLDEMCNHDIDWYTWEGDRTYHSDSARGWREELEPYITKSMELSALDKQFLEGNEGHGLDAAPLLVNVNLKAFLTEQKPYFTVIRGCIHQREGWCLAHKDFEENPDYAKDVLAEVEYLATNEENLRVWVYDVHM
jgi:hypothetical protein